jgi:WD40 repeat protein
VQDAIFNGPDEVIVASSEGLSRWALPGPRPPAAFVDEEGVSAMAFSPDGLTLWTGHPGHHQRGWSLSTGQGQRVELDSGIVKALDVDEERLVAVVTGSAGPKRPYVLHQYSMPELLRLPTLPEQWLDKVGAELGWGRSPGDPTHASRRVLLLRGGWMLLLPYGRALLASSWDGARLHNLSDRQQEWIDLGPGPGGGSAVVTSSSGTVALVEAGDPPTLRTLPLRSDGPVALVAPGGALQAVVVSGLRGLSSWDVEGRLRWRNEESAQQPRELAASPDGRYIAAGFPDHTARLYSAESGALLAVLRGHRERVSTVAFHPSLPLLATGSWDATARLWSLAELELSPAQVEARAREVWGMGLEEALR